VADQSLGFVADQSLRLKRLLLQIAHAKWDIPISLSWQDDGLHAFELAGRLAGSPAVVNITFLPVWASL
jgi:hypothetical protein